jgi:hypothetical protein
MKTIEELQSEVHELWNNFYHKRKTLNNELLEWVFEKIHENLKTFSTIENIKINVNTDYNDYSEEETIVSIEALPDDEELTDQEQIEEFMKNVVYGRLLLIDSEFIFTRGTTLKYFKQAYGY